MEKETIYIGYANQKGGCGKTTLTQLNAKALSMSMGKSVMIIECDKQMSLLNAIESQKDQNPGFVPPYKVEYCEVDKVPEVAKEAFGKYDFVFIDMPGTLDKEGILGMLSTSDILLVPFVGSQYDLDSSLKFMEMAEKVKAYKAKANTPFEYYAVINRDDKQLKESKQLKDIMEEMEIPRFESVIKLSVNFARHQGSFTDPLADKTIRFEYSKFIDEFMDITSNYLKKIEQLNSVNN